MRVKITYECFPFGCPNKDKLPVTITIPIINGTPKYNAKDVAELIMADLADSFNGEIDHAHLS